MVGSQEIVTTVGTINSMFVSPHSLQYTQWAIRALKVELRDSKNKNQLQNVTFSEDRTGDPWSFAITEKSLMPILPTLCNGKNSLISQISLHELFDKNKHGVSKRHSI